MPYKCLYESRSTKANSRSHLNVTTVTFACIGAKCAFPHVRYLAKLPTKHDSKLYTRGRSKLGHGGLKPKGDYHSPVLQAKEACWAGGVLSGSGHPYKTLFRVSSFVQETYISWLL